MPLEYTAPPRLAFALTVSLNSFADPQISKLYQAHNSAESLNKIFKDRDSWMNRPNEFDDSSNHEIVSLKDEQATFDTVVSAIVSIASKAKKGDAVTISFSTHGSHQKSPIGLYSSTNKINTMNLFDAELDEYEMFVLLRFFRKGVKMCLFFDMCHSSTWLNNGNITHHNAQAALKNMASKLNNTDLKQLFTEYYRESIASLSISAAICVIGGTRDITILSDAANSLYFFHKTYYDVEENKSKPIDIFIRKIRGVIVTDLLTKSAIREIWFPKDFVNEDCFGWYLYYHKKILKQPVDVNNIPAFDYEIHSHRKTVEYFAPNYRLIGNGTDIFKREFCIGLY